MRNLLKFYLVLLVFISANAFGIDTCQLEKLKEISADSPECYFYSGTSEFRTNDFEKAAMYWKKLIALKVVPLEVEHLKVEAYNNLGFLYFYGKGVPINKLVAIDYWTYAMKSGSEESAYHLCHAYAVKKEPTYNPKLALSYCKEGIRRYALLKVWDKQIEYIVEELNKYVRNLEK